MTSVPEKTLPTAAKVRWLVAVLCGAVGLLALAGYAWSRTDAVTAFARTQVLQLIRDELGMETKLASVRVEFPSLAVVAEGIALDHPVHGRLVEASLLRIQPSKWALLRGRPDLDSVTIADAVLALVVRDGVIVNLPTVRGGGESAEWDLPFRQVRIRNASFTVDAAPHAAGELTHVDARISVRGRTHAQIDLRVGGGMVEHAGGSEPIEAMRLRGTLGPNEVTLGDFLLRTRHLRVATRAGVLGIPVGSTYRGQAEVDFDLGYLNALPLGLKTPIEGRVRVRAQVRGSHDEPHFEGEVTLQHARIKQFGLGTRVVLPVSGDRHGIRVEKGQIEMVRGGGRIELNAQVALDAEGRPLHVQARAHDVSFAKLMDQLGVTPNAIVDWGLSGSFELNGTLDPLALRGPLLFDTRDFQVTKDAWHANPARYVLQVDRARVAGRVAVGPEGIHLEQLDGQTDRSRLSADVLLGFDNMLRVRGRSQQLDVSEISPLADFAIGGKGGFTLDVHGSFQDPALTGRVELADFSFDQHPIGDVASDVRLEKGGLAARFLDVQVAKHTSRYRARDLLLDFSEGRFSASGALEIAKLSLRDFFHTLNYADDERYDVYDASVTGQAALRYTLGYPGDSPTGTLLVDVDAGLADVGLSGYGFSDGRLGARWLWRHHERGIEGADLTLHELSLRKEQGTLHVTGGMRAGALDMVVVSDRLRLNALEGLGDRFPALDGLLGFSGTIRGTGAVPRASLDLGLTGVSWQGKPLGDARAYLRLTGRGDPWVQEAAAWTPDAPPSDAPCGHARQGFLRGRWPADPPLRTREGPKPALDEPMAFLLCGEGFDGALALDLAVGRTQVMPLRGLVAVEQMAMAPFFPRPARGEASPTGELTGRLIFSGGALHAPETLTGALSLSQLRMAQDEVALRNRGPVQVDFDRGEFRITRAAFEGSGSALEVGGGGSIYRGLGLTFAGDVDLGLLATLSSSVSRARGRLALRFNVTGPFERPGLFGNARLDNAYLALNGYADPIQDLSGVVTFSEQRIVFEAFRARVAGGQVALHGAASLRGRSVHAYDLDIQAKDLAFRPDADIELEVGGAAKLVWQQGQGLPMLRGDLRLTRMQYRRAIQLGKTLDDMYRKQRAEVERYDPEADRLEFDLRVTQGAPLRVMNNLIEAELHIQDDERPFRLVGTDQRYGLLGTLRVGRGNLRFRDTSFIIRQGEIAFNDDTRIEPRFDITASNDARRMTQVGQANWHLTLRAMGTGDSFRLETKADPYLSEEDIIMLLTVGMTRNEINQIQAGDVTGTTALEALASVSGVNREVKRALPAIDDFRIASAYSLRTYRTEPQLFVGKRLADRVRLNAATGLSEARDFRTSLEWQLAEQTSLEAIYNNQNATSASAVGDVGVDLRWRLEFE